MMANTGGTLDPILSDIEDAIVAFGLSATQFGYVVAGDPTLVPKMRGGRRVKKRALREKIETALRRLREGGEL